MRITGWWIGAFAVAATIAACGSESDGGGVTGTSSSASSASSSSTTTSGSGGGGADDATSAVTTSGSGGSGGCDVAADCDDDDMCTDDACSDGVCNHFPVDIDDDDACTEDACDPVSGVTNTPVDIDDGDPCSADLCDPETGEITHTGGGCDDFDVCTADSCDEGAGCTNTPGACLPTFAGVQPIFVAKCTPCHDGDTPTGCAGGTCFVNHYEGATLTLEGGACDGQLAYDCILATILDASMPRGVECTGDPAQDVGIPGCIQAEELAAIEAWIGAGAPP